MGNVPTPRARPNITLCLDIPHTVAYRRETIYMYAPRYDVRRHFPVYRRVLRFSTECDKSFTRSDALAKHMRLQHNISPPAPGRGGSKKRKRPADDQPVAVHPSSRVLSPPPVRTAGGGAFSTFKLEQNPYPDLSHSFTQQKPEDDPAHKVATNGYRSVSPLSPPYPPRLASPPDPNRHDEDEGYTSSTSDTLPAHLLPHYVPATNLVLGRTPSMVMYLLMKAKHKYALEQHESLLEELRVARAELKKEKEEKESTLDEFLRGMFG